MDFSLEKYKSLLNSFKKENYNFVSFNSHIYSTRNIILRHDVDFDINKALEMAMVENSLEVASTYFFLINSKSYNFLSKENLKSIKKIKSLGHDISIHFDTTIYKNEELGFYREVEIFESNIGIRPSIISFHRPNKELLSHHDDYFGIPHTYQAKFFSDIKYISDSGGDFFFDHPLECDEFKNSLSIQLLIHPIWWTTKGNTNIEKIKNYLNENKNMSSQHFAKNCKPWASYLNSHK